METMKSIRKSCWTIMKLIFPIYVAVDILHYLGVLKLFSTLFTPISSLLGLPPEAALALAGGGIFNLYTGIALASPLGLSAHQWTIVAVFLGLFHSIVIEAAVLKKLKIPVWVTVSIRLGAAILCSYIVSRMGVEFGNSTSHSVVKLQQFSTFTEMLKHSVINAAIITGKVMILIALIIWIFDMVKKSSLFGKSATSHSWFFNIMVGLLLGVTYGAGLLLNEEANKARSNLPSAFFLVLCHGIIEETLLFTMFGASALPIVASRLVTALFLSFTVYIVLKNRLKAKNTLQESIV